MGFHSHKAVPVPPGQLAEAVNSAPAVLVEFAEPDAPACRLEEPIVGQLMRLYEGRLKVVRADVEASPEEAKAFSVAAVPTFVLFVGGEEKLRLSGYQSMDDLSQALDASPLPSAG